jgi:putative transcriptional regulator
MSIEFEWDEDKAAENLAVHDIAFRKASFVFTDPFSIEEIDNRIDYGEDRFIRIGLSEGNCWPSSTQKDMKKFASSLRAKKKEVRKKTTIARIRSDGKVVRVLSDGTEELIPVEPFHHWTDAQIDAAAAKDPDNPPLTKEQLAKFHRVPQVKTLRFTLGLSQEEFAKRYRIPLGTLRDWEQGRTEPDEAARAYIDVIAHDPAHVLKALRATAKKTHQGAKRPASV